MTRPVVLVTPISPSDRGNGLAMRAGMFLEALSAATPVHLVVVPVAGLTPFDNRLAPHTQTVTIVEPVTAGDADRHVVLQMGDATLRALLERTAPLPARARLAPPTLVDDALGHIEAGLDGEAPIVVTMRNYLAPFGITLARRLRAPRVIVDLDDDDEALLRDNAHVAEAEAAARLARGWLDGVDVVTLASPEEANRVARRYGLANVDVIANTARPPLVTPRPAAGTRIVFVGNLTYGPNIDAARTLALDVLPALRRLHPTACVDLVGAGGQRIAGLEQVEGVTVAGAVPDVTPWYENAAAVVTPLESGGGTRIKVLEAFAHRRPVIATSAAVAGLAIRPGVDVLIAGTADELARATAAVLSDAELGGRLSAAAFETFAAHYAPDVVAPIIRRVVLGDEHRVEGTW